MFADNTRLTPGFHDGQSVLYPFPHSVKEKDEMWARVANPGITPQHDVHAVSVTSISWEEKLSVRAARDATSW